MPTWKMSSNFAFLLASLRCLTILNSRRCNQIFRSYSTQWFLGGLFTKYKSRFSSYLIRSEFLTLTWTPWRSLTVAATSSSSKVQNVSHLKLDQFKCFTICQSEKHILWKDQLNKKFPILVIFDMFSDQNQNPHPNHGFDFDDENAFRGGLPQKSCLSDRERNKLANLPLVSQTMAMSFGQIVHKIGQSYIEKISSVWWLLGHLIFIGCLWNGQACDIIIRRVSVTLTWCWYWRSLPSSLSNGKCDVFA